jgi:pimeloyl-ACP methyl ester carboxylesterase
MIHGLSFSSEIFRPFIRYFREDYTLIIPDLPGHGQSSRLKKFPKNYLDNCASILIDLLKKEKTEKVSIIGVGSGGVISLNMALKAPKMIDRIVADSFPGKKISNGNLDLMIEETKKRSKTILHRMYMKSIHGKDWRTIVENDLNFFESLKYSDHRVVVPDLEKIKCKVLLTGSYRYNMVPRLAPVYKKIQDKNPNFEVSLFKSGVQISLFSNRKKLLLEIKKFLA